MLGRTPDYVNVVLSGHTARADIWAQGKPEGYERLKKFHREVIDGDFAMAIAICTAVLYWYTRCLRSTLLVVGCSLVAVTWQLGIIAWLGYAIDPYSVLVPFLIFAIGVSHAAQKMNGIMQDIARGTHRQIAARYTFRRLFLAGVTALLADAVGFEDLQRRHDLPGAGDGDLEGAVRHLAHPPGDDLGRAVQRVERAGEAVGAAP